VKLHRQLILLVLAALMPLVLLSALLGSVALRQGQKEMARDAASRTTILADAVERELRAQTEGLQTLSMSPMLDGPVDEAMFRAYARRLLALHPLWMDVSLVDPAGDRIYDTPERPPQIARRVIDLESHAKAVHTQRPVVGRIMRSPRGVAAFAIFVPVIRDGKVTSVVSAVVRPTSVRQILLSSGLPAGWRAGVIDRSSHVVTRTLQPDQSTQSAGADAIDALRQADEGVYRIRGGDGTPMMVAYRVLPVSGWSVHVGLPQGLYEAPARRALWLVAGGVFFGLLLIAIFLGLLTREMGIHQRQAAALEESRRLEALGRITGGVAHDFNNILMIVQGSAELLKRRIAGAKAEGLVDAILSGAQRGQALTRQLLAVGRRSAHEPVSFRLQDLAPDLLALLQRTVPPDVAVRLEPNADAWPIHADPRALEVALINLAVNARDAMPSGGRLTVSAANVTLQKGRDEGTGLAGEFVALAVADTGVGIAEAHLAHVFEPFFTTKPSGKGTGLGLSQVYGFARQSLGAVTVRSRLGEGATITLYLPRASEPPVRPVASAPAGTAQQDGRVFLVEDNAAVGEAIEAMLTSLGFSVTRAGDASSALARLARGEEADLLLSDIVMEGMTGLDLGRRLRELRPDLPIVLMTGYSEALAGRSSDEFPVLAKPFGAQELAAALAKVRAKAPATEPT
jgi:signal transduction histidine kinase/ActR/RegA family two-component response regulator